MIKNDLIIVYDQTSSDMFVRAYMHIKLLLL